MDINVHWNQRTLKFCRFCLRPFWKWRPFARDFFFGQNILPTLFNIYAKSCGNPFGSFRYKWGQRFWHMFIIIIIIIRNGAKTISLQTSFGDLIRNRANTICLPKLRLGDIIKNGANTTRYDSIWLPNVGYQFATS